MAFQDNVKTTVTNTLDRYRSNIVPGPENRLNFPDTSPTQATRGMLIPYMGDGKSLPLDRSVIFQFNPEEISYEKTLNLEHHERLGFPYTIPFWVSGGSRIISFQLFLDATPGSNYRLFKRATSSPITNNSVNSPYINFNDYYTSGLADGSEGLLPEIQKIENYMYPVDKKRQQLSSFSSRRQVHGTTQSFNSSNPDVITIEKFSNPPFVIFSYGNIYAVTLIVGYKRVDKLFNKDLNPVRSTIDLSLEVHEAKIIDTNIVFDNRKNVNVNRLNNAS